MKVFVILQGLQVIAASEDIQLFEKNNQINFNSNCIVKFKGMLIPSSFMISSNLESLLEANYIAWDY